jgi:hypothetical protein
MPYFNSGGEIWVGRVQVFTFSNETFGWEQKGETIDGAIEFDQFGLKVGLSKNDGEVIAVTTLSSNGTFRGLVHVYRFADGIWSPLGNAISGISPENLFGEQFDLSPNGDIIAVGDTQANSGADSGGYIAVWQWDGEEWTLMGPIMRGMNSLGVNVALSSNGLTVAGTDQEDETGTSFSTVFIAYTES